MWRIENHDPQSLQAQRIAEDFLEFDPGERQGFPDWFRDHLWPAVDEALVIGEEVAWPALREAMAEATPPFRRQISQPDHGFRYPKAVWLTRVSRALKEQLPRLREEKAAREKVEWEEPSAIDDLGRGVVKPMPSAEQVIRNMRRLAFERKNGRKPE